MKWSLTDKEKKVKPSKTRKYAILWSECELRRKHLKQQQNQVITAVVSAPSIDTVTLEDSIPKSTLLDITSVLSQSPTKETIHTFKRTIHDLQIQRRELDITINALKKYLQ